MIAYCAVNAVPMIAVELGVSVVIGISVGGSMVVRMSVTLMLLEEICEVEFLPADG